MPAAATRIKTSVGPISGTGTSAFSSGFPTCVSRTALMQGIYLRNAGKQESKLIFLRSCFLNDLFSLRSAWPRRRCRLRRHIRTAHVYSHCPFSVGFLLPYLAILAVVFAAVLHRHFVRAG